MSWTVCELSEEKQLEKQKEAKYVCKKCGAEAKKEKHLCKPKKIKEDEEA